MIPGPQRSGERFSYTCWAPGHREVELLICADPGSAPRAASGIKATGLPPATELLPMQRMKNGYFSAECEFPPNGRYGFVIDGTVYPDPASRSQPEGVHALSAVPADDFMWSDAAYNPVPLEDLVIYELHVGTFTAEGTFDAAADRLTALAEIGVTCVEVMPVAPFPGERNWGYDGVYPWAVQASYGGPEGLKRFVDAAHQAGLSVILDVVFNHLGPEGNYSRQYGPYFTDRYQTPWGEALNFDGPGSDGVRDFFLGSVRYWLEQFHLDGFRLDAVHEIHDEAGVPFLREVGRIAREVSVASGRQRVVIAESDLNDRRIVEPVERNGMGLDAAWADDFHHAMHVTLTGERLGYYQDYDNPHHLARSIERGWSYSWDYSPSRDRHHGTDPANLPPTSFVFCTQNHDQIGNRMRGERMTELAGHSADRVSRVVLLLAPAIPLLFMGQEYGEKRPFLYFVDHSDEGLLAATREGRAREFEAFHDGRPPDPGASETYERSILDWQRRGEGDELELTRTLLGLRRRFDCFGARSGDCPRTAAMDAGVLTLCLGPADQQGLVLANLSDTSVSIGASGINSTDTYHEVMSLGSATRTGDGFEFAPFSALVLVSGYGAQESVQFQN